MDTFNFEIPVDDAISGFLNHLRANPRTILSSKFGDGKSFFLNKFINSAIVKQDYEVLTIFPVNYQTIDNKDVFELLKYDILCQLIQHNMLFLQTGLNDTDAFSWFLSHKKQTIIDEIITILPLLGTASSSVPIVLKGVKKISKLATDYKEFCKSKTEQNIVDEYCSILRNYQYMKSILYLK